MLFAGILTITITPEAYDSPVPTICQSFPDLSTVPADLSLRSLSSRSKSGRVASGTRSIVRLGGAWADRPAYL